MNKEQIEKKFKENAALLTLENTTPLLIMTKETFIRVVQEMMELKRNDVEQAIRTTLVIQNPESVHIAIDKIFTTP